MATKRSLTIPVDFNKLEYIRISNGLEYADMSYKLGHERSWYSHVKISGTMRRTDALLVQSIWGVDVIIKEPKKSVPDKPDKTEESSAFIDYDKLAEAMSKAIDYDRLAGILEKAIDYKMLGEVLTFAMKEALKG